MRHALAAASVAAPALSAGGPTARTLPETPAATAATCGVVAAADARSRVADIQAPLPFEAQAKIIHYTMIPASADGSFAATEAAAVSARMSELQEGITSGKWQELAPACKAAYPQAEKTAVELPGDRIRAGLTCDALVEFLADALRQQEAAYADQYGVMSTLSRSLDSTMGPGLRARVGGSLEAQNEARDKALAEAVGLGSPAAMLQQCEARFVEE